MSNRFHALLLLATIVGLSGCASQKTDTRPAPAPVPASTAPASIYNGDTHVDTSQIPFEGQQDFHFNDARPSQCTADENMLITPAELKARILAWSSRHHAGHKLRPAAPIAYPQQMIFPEQAWAKGLRSGAATVAMFVDEKGHIATVLPLCASDPVFVGSAIEAAHRYQFHAASLDGQAVHGIAIERFAFLTTSQ